MRGNNGIAVNQTHRPGIVLAMSTRKGERRQRGRRLAAPPWYAPAGGDRLGACADRGRRLKPRREIQRG